MDLHVFECEAFRGSLTVASDKSISHRALLFGSIASGVSQVRNWLPAADCRATLRAVRALGIEVQETGLNQFRVHGRGLRGLISPPGGPVIDCQGSGTTMRLIAGILAGQSFTSTVDGHSGLRRRPMERIAVPLRLMGADVSTTDGKPPVTIRGGRLSAIDYQMPVASAQIKSAILLAAMYAHGETIIHQPGPARDHTERMLRAQGATIVEQGDTIRMMGEVADLAPLDVTVPADFSSAAFPMAAACIVPGSRITLRQVNVNFTRTGLLDVLLRMGARIEVQNEVEITGEPVADITVQTSDLTAVEVKGHVVVRMIDEFPILAVLATQAHGVTTIRDAQELRVKESDRIAAVAHELRQMGAHVEEYPDGFAIEGPTRLTGGVVSSHLDHRLAMALVVAGLAAAGETTVTGAEVIGDSFPGFEAGMRQLGAGIA